MYDEETDSEEGPRGAKASREALDMFEALTAEFSAMVPMDEVTNAAQKVALLDAECKALEAELKAKKYVLHQLRSKVLVEAMAKINQSKFTIAEGDFAGVTLSVEMYTSGALPKDEVARAEAIKLLEKYEAVDMIRNVLSLEFTKNQHNIALEMRARLEEEGFDVLMKSDIHAKTLGKLVTDRISNGDDVDPEKLGIYVGKIVKLTWPKAPKEKKAKK